MLLSTGESLPNCHFIVDAVVETPKGAYPCSCFNYYDADYDHIKDYLAAAAKDRFDEYLDQYVYAEKGVGA